VEEIMAFSVGDKVVHPGIGAGRITGTKHQELVAGFEHYYVIDIPSRSSTIYVPIRTAAELGMRPAMSQGKIARVLHTLTSKPHPLPENYNERQEELEEKLRTDRPIMTAEVVRDLAWHERATPLNSKDKELLARGRSLLAGEIALVTEANVDDVNELIGERLAAGMSGHPRRTQPAKKSAASGQPSVVRRK
jgi:CarD family transcriptional regulator